MESEIAGEIPEYSAPSLHVDETENVLNSKNELLKGDLSDNENNLTLLHVVVAPGQIVPSQDTKAIGTGYSETEAKDSNGYSTVPQASESMDYVEEQEHVLKKIGMSQGNFVSDGKGVEQFTSPMNLSSEVKRHEYPVKAWHWPPIGLKDQITELPIPNTFDHVVSNENAENDDNKITVAKQVFLTTTASYRSSNNVDQSEINVSFQEENKTLTSILKKDDNQAKKSTTVHFPENFVSVKFYDISEDEDSDNDTVILSDPEEEDDLRDQEVPLNTYGDYIANRCFPFIPQFSFPPVLKLANDQLYDNINDDEEDQILAIMGDDDGRGKQQHLVNVSVTTIPTDASYNEESVSEFHDGQLTSKDAKNLEDAIQLQTPKIGFEGLEVVLEDKTKTTTETRSESLVVGENACTEDMITVGIESPVVTAITTTYTRNESDNEDPVSELDALPQDVLVPSSSTEVAKETESNEISDADAGTDVTQTSSITSHGNCGNKFLWRGPRTLNSMIVDEDVNVSPVPSLSNDTLYRSSLTKEEIKFPKEALVDVESRELNILASVKNESAISKHYQEEFHLEKYTIQSFISYPDHLSKFHETWQLADFPNKIRKVENDTHISGLKSGIAENVEQHGTEFCDDDGTRKDDNHDGAYSKGCDLVKQPAENGHHLTPQIVPDMDIQDELKALPMHDPSRAVPSGVDDVMDTTNASLHLTDYPSQCNKVSLSCEDLEEHQDQHTGCSNIKLEEEKNISRNHTSVFKPSSGLPHTPFLVKQGKRKLRVGLSKSTRVKPLHPYWSKEKIK